MASKPLPTTESEWRSFTKNFAEKAVQFQVTLGLTPADLESIDACAENYDYLVQFSYSLQADRDAFYDFKRKMLTGPVIATPENPSFTSVSLPAASGGGIQEQMRRIIRRVKAAPGYTAQIGEALGLESPDNLAPDLETITTEVRATALPDGVMKIRYYKKGMDGARIEYKKPLEPGWNSLGNYKAAEVQYQLSGDLLAQPEKLLYRVRLLKNDQMVGNYSPVVAVITNP